MRKAIVLCCMLTAGPAIAQVTKEDMQFTAIKLFLYDKMCTPVPPKVKEMTDHLLETISQREKLRMFQELKAAIDAADISTFCGAIRPAVKQLDEMFNEKK